MSDAPERIALWVAPDVDPHTLSDDVLRGAAARQLGRELDAIGAVRVRKISFDARKKHMQWRVSLEVWPAGAEAPPPPAIESPNLPSPPTDAPVVAIVGSGPAGLFCALRLLAAGIRPVVLERGQDVQARRRAIAQLNRGEALDPESNYAFGEGGAGTYSDGKLYTRSGKRGDVRGVLETLVAHGAPPAILTSWRPHVGSNILPKVVQALRDTITRAGGEIRFGARVVRLLQDAPGAPVRGVALADGSTVDAAAVVLATGHSALDAILMAREAGAALAPKGFAVGVRVEHPQAWLDEIQYHGRKEEAGLPPAFYEVSTQVRERGVFSFCMCPGGWIVPSHALPGTLVVNGMSLAKRDSPFANSGVVVGLEPKDWCGKRGWRWGWPDLLQRAAALSEHPLLHEVVEDPRGGPPIPVAEGRLPVHPDMDPLFGARIQLALEVVAADAGGGAQKAPAQRCDRFVDGKEAGDADDLLPTSYLPGLTPADFGALLPRGVAARLRQALQDFDRMLPAFSGPQGQLVGVETRTSSPVRILRGGEDADRPLEAEGAPGLYPCGEGAGYAGGIVSAALDGVRAAEALTPALVQTGGAAGR